MSESKFKTLRHIETVRNYLNAIIKELIERQEWHDQSKLEQPEVDIFEEYTPKLKNCTYDSDEYRQNMKEMKVAIDHHNSVNRHHPEYFSDGIESMTLVDLIEMICDWKSAGLRHDDGNLFKSIRINKDRFKISDQLEIIMNNTADWFDRINVRHKGNES